MIARPACCRVMAGWVVLVLVVEVTEHLKCGTFSSTVRGFCTTIGDRGRDLRTRLRSPKQRLSSTSGDGDLGQYL